MREAHRPHRPHPWSSGQRVNYLAADPVDALHVGSLDFDIRFILAATGKLIRELTLGPTKRHQATGRPPGRARGVPEGDPESSKRGGVDAEDCQLAVDPPSEYGGGGRGAGVRLVSEGFADTVLRDIREASPYDWKTVAGASQPRRA